MCWASMYFNFCKWQDKRQNAVKDLTFFQSNYLMERSIYVNHLPDIVRDAEFVGFMPY